MIYEPNLKKRSGSRVDDESIICTQKKQTSEGTITTLGSQEKKNVINNSWFIGWDIPDFHRRMKTGELLPHTPFTQFSCNGNSEGYYEWWDTNSVRWFYEPSYPGFQDQWILTQDVLEQYVPATYDQYVTEAAAKIYNDGFDALTFMAELKDVKRSFTSAAKLLRDVKMPFDSYRYTGKFKIGKVKEKFGYDRITSEWLGVRYGWRPLISELTKLNEKITNLQNVRTRYSERAGTTYVSTEHDSEVKEWSAFYVDLSWTTRITVAIRGSVCADIEVPALQFNPLQTGWEVIPLSFVIDWFVNVGSTLAALSFLARQKSYAASAGYKVTAKRTFEASLGQTKSSYSHGSGMTQTATCLATLEKRVPKPVRYFPFPVVKLNSMKLLDLMALVLQRLN